MMECLLLVATPHFKTVSGARIKKTYLRSKNLTMNNKQTPLFIEGVSEDIYAGFWIRLKANILDAILFIPVICVSLYLMRFGVVALLLSLIPSLLFTLWYQVYLVEKHGGTPGKLLMGVKIININGNEIGWNEAILRECITIGINILSTLSTIWVVTNLVDESHFLSLGLLEKMEYMENLTPVKNKIELWVINIWAYSELLVLLLNKRKRAIHDYIAGTVVIKKEYENAIRRSMERI